MSSQGGRSFDIIRQIAGNVVNIFNKRASVCIAPCDGWVLKMHYQWTFWIFMGGFSAIWYSWFHRDVIQCVSHFSAETQVRLDYMNICLSYPFVELPDKSKRYLLFYRWVHWVFLLIAGLYYIPRKMSKSSDNPKVKKLFEDLAVTVHRYDLEKEHLERTAKYMVFNLKTHNGLYYKYLMCNVVALSIDIFCFHFLDFVFQGRFMRYGFNAYPFYRDPRKFTDPMSVTFPPFAKCTLHKHVQIVDQRIEQFGCHLTVMELYEKIFLFVWFWLITLMVITISYIIYLILMWGVGAIRLHILRIAKPVQANNNVRSVVCSVITNCKIGDVYLLYRLRQFFSHAKFYELLNKLADRELIQTMLENVRIDMPVNKAPLDLRSRKPNMKPGAMYPGVDRRYNL